MRVILITLGLTVSLAGLFIWRVKEADREWKIRLETVDQSIRELVSAKTRIAAAPVRSSARKPPSSLATTVSLANRNKPKAKTAAGDSKGSSNPPDGYYQLYHPEAIVDYIKVVIDEQRLYAFSRQKLVMMEMVSTAFTGINLPLGDKADFPHNHLGVFQIQSKNKNAYSQEYDCPMPSAMSYYGGHYIHRTEPKFYHLLGLPTSHGCVREGPEAAEWLFNRTPVGAVVEIVASQNAVFTEPLSLKAAGAG
jgi:hypothetical protein